MGFLDFKPPEDEKPIKKTFRFTFNFTIDPKVVLLVIAVIVFGIATVLS